MIPKFKIRADILMYIIVLGGGTAGAFTFSEVYGLSEEDKLKALKEKYPVQIKKNEDQHQQLQAFFDQMKEGNSPEMDKKFNTVLRSGKSEVKRLHRYDEQDILKTKIKEGNDIIESKGKDKANVIPVPIETEPSAQSKSVWNLWGWWS